MSATATSAHGRVRRAISILLIVLAGPVALGGGVLLYVREEIVDSRAFADRAADALRMPAVSHVAAKEFAVQVVEPAVPDAIAARPLVIDGMDRLIQTNAFQPVLRTAAEHGHRLLFERGSNAVFDVADAGAVVTSALQTLAPKIAKELPKHAETILLTIRRRSFAGQTLYYADHVRWLGVVLPVLAIALLAGGIAVAPDRRKAITFGGIVIGVAGAVLALALVVVRHYIVTHVYGAQELTNADVRGAVGGIWTGMFGDLMTWALWVGGLAWLIAAASASLLSPYSTGNEFEQLRALARKPLSPRGRGVRAVVVLAIGLWAVLKPRTVVSIVVVLVGAALIYIAIGELLSVTAPAEPRSRPSRRRVIRRLATVAGALTTAVIAFVLALLVTGGARPSQASTIMTCNGYAQLCDRRLDQVVFAGTHNSMSAADSHGWLIANQDRDVTQQLGDGIRLFKISTHYATEDAAGGVHTDIAAEGTNLNRVAKKLDPSARLALQRLSVGLGTGSLQGRRRDIWLCHTLCELGATRMVDFLGALRTFVRERPNNVLILFDEDYVSERDLRNAFVRAKLFRRLAVLNRNQPLPTLRDLIRSRHNVIVFAQKDTSGHFPWNHDAFQGWIQDTLLGVTKPAQFSCAYVRDKPGGKPVEARGAAASPLLMMNNWADIFPPRPKPNIPLQQRAFILHRARQCVAQRGRIPNLILTDYYNRGDVIGAVDQLNGVSGSPAP
jgi:hypothetical protein